MIITGPTLATIIVAAFGGVWCLYGASRLPGRRRAIAAVAAVVISVVLIAGGIHHTGVVGREFLLPTYYAAVAFEAIAIIVVVAVMRRSNRVTMIGPSIAIIVGLHFIGLFLATGDALFLWLCAALCAVGIGAVLRQPSSRAMAAGFGSALVLWAAALTMIVR